MHIVNIGTPAQDNRLPILNLGFRPFFMGAGLFAILSICIWFLQYLLYIPLPLDAINPFQWHAHEMIYGFSLAVISGFLLTATKNWTGIQTLNGLPLLGLVALWLVPRLLLPFGLTHVAAFFDLLFMGALIIAVVNPIIRAKNYKQLAVASKLIVLLIFNALFYLGALGLVDNGIYLGLYGGLYLVIGIILMIGRRVIPFFIERGVDETVKLRNSKIIDISSLVLFIVFFVAELTHHYPLVAAYSALLLTNINAIRLIGWHTRGIWQKPLLWSLYLAMWSITFGFFLIFLSHVTGFSLYSAIHAFSIGGIGLITLSMMARVSLGHTARNIHQPPASMRIAFISIIFGTIFRVAFCSFWPAHYLLWIGLAMACWFLAFTIFVVQYYPILKNKRLDGQFG